MQKGKNKKGNNKNVLSRLTKEIKTKNNPVSTLKNSNHAFIDDNKFKNLRSNLETNNLDEYLELTKMAQKKYEALNEQIVVQNLNTDNVKFLENQFSSIFLENIVKNSEIQISQCEYISIPRRPKWTKEIPVKEFERLEREAYLTWRKALAEQEEKNINKSITPFEKNIEIWKQLWIVCEKSDLLIQIVDGRNPLYYRSPDLEKYIKEINPDKEILLLINKADLLSEEIRKHWADYFRENGIGFLFFSAMMEGNKLEEEKEDENENNNEEIEQPYKVLNRNELITKIYQILKEKPKNKIHNCHYVGFVGFPNVGKSSVINVLMKQKKVAVAQMPGKTKHYQTLFLPEDKELCLVDCPGLVFPSFTCSKADMLINGVLPIDTLREYLTSIALIIYYIPKHILEAFYHIQLPDLYSASQFLQVVASKKGYISGRALPDEAKTAKVILKDYVSGRLLYCHLRPDYVKDKHGVLIQYNDIYGNNVKEEDKKEINQEELENHKELMKNIPCDFDEDFEKIGIEIGSKKQIKNELKDMEEEFFGLNDDFVGPDGSKITKDVKRALKFAFKRGEISEEVYENVETLEEAAEILKKISEKPKTKEIVGVKKINF